ncbi:hypothetical protein [Desmospora activa]|uniref:Uncharacterized protein n=1 Tax=Desmospora activa DSM 45169 TaxID=1121389 RepID=A0A2T4Z3Y5_9BACL|nr:hypothetical protein [Desmospora activa]PTM56585.1 hypothetical protein C8J48_2907 [Desmospora activa DSM 45169]
MRRKWFAFGLVCMMVLSFFSFGVPTSEAATEEGLYYEGKATFESSVQSKPFFYNEKNGNLQLDMWGEFRNGTPNYDYIVVSLYEAESNIKMGNSIAIRWDGDIAYWNVPSGNYYLKFEKPRDGLKYHMTFEVFEYNG